MPVLRPQVDGIATPLVAHVAREIDGRHVATADFAFDGVAVSEGSPEAFGDGRHGA